MEHKEYKKLHAEWYELGSAGDQSKEIDYWEKCIKESGEPALELGSGTGRVLIPLLKLGFDIVGIDTSEDMMARCLATCKTQGLKAELHDQSMVNFALPRKFGLIFLDSGGLGLFISDQDIHVTFERVITHLKPGGLFIYEFQPVKDEKDTDKDKKDVEWGGDWKWVKASSGVFITMREKYKYNPNTHVWESLRIHEKFVDGCLVGTEANERYGRNFTVDEAVQYAKSVGFEDIKATNWLTEDPPNKDSHVITIKCRKSK